MKLKLSEEARTKILTNFIVTALSIILFFIIYNATGIYREIKSIFSILTPFIYGFAIAYILAIPMKFLETRVLNFLDKKRKFKLKRMLAITITYVVAGIALGAFFSILIPEIARSISTLIENIPEYGMAVEHSVTVLVEKLQLDMSIVNEIIDDFRSISVYLTEFAGKVVTYLIQFSAIITQSILNIIIGTIVSIYILTSKEKFFAQTKKLMYSVLPKRPVNYIVELTRSSNKIFIGFLGGKLLDSFIIAIICFVGMSIFKMPYALLVSFIIGITNIVPVFGPFIGAIPSIIIIFIASPIKALWFAIFVLVLQQFDGNILGPKILGNSIGISAFWVMFAIILGNGIFGFVGMIIGVPLFAVIYSIIKSIVEYQLSKKGLPINTEKYASEEHEMKF
ncbi:MAG: AI-2E family transporter [Clostridium sp.]|nr:AI-2E family transporter [Clostridium sp.]